jgi:hypothetical protein
VEVELGVWLPKPSESLRGSHARALQACGGQAPLAPETAGPPGTDIKLPKIVGKAPDASSPTPRVKAVQQWVLSGS